MTTLFSHRVRSTSREGSALVLTLLVVSLLVVLVLAFSVHVRMELRSVREVQQLRQAQANALLGANLAIARLQELAGPDTRVTAPPALPESDPEYRRQIGMVLESSAFRTPTAGGALEYNPDFAKTLGYLLSIDVTQPFDLATYTPFASNGIPLPGHALLVGPGTVDSLGKRIAAPELDIKNDKGQPDGSYSFWIRDEGLKAQINLVDTLQTSTTTSDIRARRATAQRNATERILTKFDPKSPTHNLILGRALTAEQLNVTGYGDKAFSREFYHDVTLQSLGLPANTSLGGLKRDLTAVMQEISKLPGAVTPPAASASPTSQFGKLLKFQQDRILRWRGETLARPSTRPPHLADRHWNSLNAISLRADQANPAFNENIFPPMSDLNITYDPGGATWSQLLSHATLRNRRMANGALQSAKPWNGNTGPTEALEVMPVLSRINLSFYYTLDWPHVALHMVPFVVLWNPYSEPLSLPSGQQWHVRLNYGTTVFLNDGNRYPFRLKVRNSAWDPSPSYAHIVNQELWTPRLTVGYNPNNPGPFLFRLADRNGGNRVVIPPGEAVVFTMHRHKEIATSPSDPGDYKTHRSPAYTTIELRQGLSNLGLFSFYVKENVNDQVVQTAISSPHGYMDGVSAWDHVKVKRTDPNDGITTWGYPFPFYLDRDPVTNLPRNKPTGAKNEVLDPALEPIAVNVNGLTHWDILEIGVVLGKGGQTGSNLMGLSFDLFGESISDANKDKEWGKFRFANQQLPRWIHSASPDDGKNITPVYVPQKIPADDEPFIIGVTPSFPAWGMSWGLRLPDPSFEFNTTDPNAASMSAPIRWLRDFNPAAPFLIRDPASRLVGSRFDRFGYRSNPLYIGGFYMGDGAYADIDQFSFNDTGNVFIGFSDIPFETQGDIPKAILYEIPESVNDLTSMASLQQARLHPTRHAGTGGDARTLADHTTNYGYMMPAHTIGNSFSHLLVDSSRAIQSFYPSYENSDPAQIPESIPYASTKSPRDFGSYAHNDGLLGSFFPGYDSSWIYNTVLWDDFLFTSDYNTRFVWYPPYQDPAYRTAGNPMQGTHRDFTDSASRMLVQGAFNVNSTSVAAWALLLESMLGVDSSAPQDVSSFRRFLTQNPTFFDSETDDYASVSAHVGNRVLSREQIWNPSSNTGLAVEIVRQIKRRGPFISLADFVNRSLVPASNPDAHAGVLQSAIDTMGLNNALGTTGTDMWLNPATDYPGTASRGGPMYFGLSTANTSGRKTSGASAEITQADILSRIGSVLQVRSDTFTVRSYGSLGPSGTSSARAWCEVVVQRAPNYVDPVNSAGDLPSSLNVINQKFGRRFRIISFRWLGEEEI
jgi:hypothetical protein